VCGIVSTANFVPVMVYIVTALLGRVGVSVWN
jgi:hypothetical protein